MEIVTCLRHDDVDGALSAHDLAWETYGEHDPKKLLDELLGAGIVDELNETQLRLMSPVCTMDAHVGTLADYAGWPLIGRLFERKCREAQAIRDQAWGELKPQVDNLRRLLTFYQHRERLLATVAA